MASSGSTVGITEEVRGTIPSDLSRALHLRISRSGSPDRRLSISADRCTLGSGEGSTIRLSDPTIRQTHAVILTSGGRVLIRGYALPLEVNGQFTLEAFLKPGDFFALGQFRFEILSIPTPPQHDGDSGNDYREDPAHHTLRSQWIRTQQRLEALTERYQQTLQSLEEAREESHQARRRVEALQRECQDRADLQANQAQSHAAELQEQVDQIAQLHTEIFRLREQLSQSQTDLDDAKREYERASRREAQLSSQVATHAAQQSQWERRLAELTRQVLSAQPTASTSAMPPTAGARPTTDHRDTLDLRDTNNEATNQASPLTDAAVQQATVESRMLKMLAKIGVASDPSKTSRPSPQHDGHPTPGASDPLPQPSLTRVSPLGNQAAMARHDGRFPSRPATEMTRPATEMTRPFTRPEGPSGRTRIHLPWQLIVLPLVAILMFLLARQTGELRWVWYTAGGLTCGLIGFVALEWWQGFSIAKSSSSHLPRRDTRQATT